MTRKNDGELICYYVFLYFEIRTMVIEDSSSVGGECHKRGVDVFFGNVWGTRVKSKYKRLCDLRETGCC